MKRWPAFVVLFALLASAASLAWRTGRSTMLSWLTYPPRSAAVAPARSGSPAPRTGSEPAPALTSHLVVVVIGGLRSDAALALPALSLLRERGAFRTLTAEAPTESTSTWATLLSGSDPYLHGQLSDASVRTLAVDTLFDEAKSQGLTTALSGPDALGRLLPRAVDLGAFEPAGATESRPTTGGGAQANEALFQHALTAVQAKAGLTLVYLGDPLAAGRASGGTTPAYQAAAAQTDARLAQLLEQVDMAETTVLVTSDHGLTDRGGYGGAEPDVTDVFLVAAGKGIVPGLFPQARQRDLAPTAAALLGLPSPAAATGSALVDMLAFPRPGDAGTVLRLGAERQTALFRSLVDQMGGRLEAPALKPEDPRAAGLYLAELQKGAAAALRYRWWLDVKQRLPWAGGLALLLLLYLLVLGRQPYGRGVLAGAGVYFALYYALFLGPWRLGPFAPQHSLTFSLSRLSSIPYAAFLKQRALEAGLAGLAASLLAGAIAGGAEAARRNASRIDTGGPEPDRRGGAALARRPAGGAVPGLHLALAIVALLGLQALGFWVAYGQSFGATLPPTPWLIKQVLDLTQVVAVATASPAMAAVAAIAFRLRLGRRRGD